MYLFRKHDSTNYLLPLRCQRSPLCLMNVVCVVDGHQCALKCEMWFFVSHSVAMPPKDSKDIGKETAGRAKNGGGGKRKEGGPSNGTP